MVKSLSNRQHYSSLENATYLNQASLGLIGQPAVEAMHSFLDQVGRHGNLFMTDDEEVAFFSDLRGQAAKILNCHSEQLAIIGSAGEMLNQLPYLFAPKSGSKIVAISSEFPAITRPWIAYCERNSCELTFVDEIENEDITDTLIQEIHEQTSVVLVSYVQFSTGSRADIARLRQASRNVGARLVVDVTQAAGATSIDAKAWEADVIVCSGYKWLGGHGGVALAVMSPEFLSQVPPAPGWMGAPNPFDFRATELPLADDARRYTQSTMSYISLKCLTVAITDLLDLGISRIENHTKSLATMLVDELVDSYWRTYGPRDKVLAAPHIVTLSHSKGELGSIVEDLTKEGIICGNRNNRLRISLAHYNNESDVRALVRVLRRQAETISSILYNRTVNEPVE